MSLSGDGAPFSWLSVWSVAEAAAGARSVPPSMVWGAAGGKPALSLNEAKASGADSGAAGFEGSIALGRAFGSVAQPATDPIRKTADK